MTPILYCILFLIIPNADHATTMDMATFLSSASASVLYAPVEIVRSKFERFKTNAYDYIKINPQLTFKLNN